jgi:hypothetical protein
VVAVIVEAEVQWVAGELFFQARIARIQIHFRVAFAIEGRAIPRRHDVLAHGREVRREGVAMAVTANITVGVGWRICIDVMLAQTSSPSLRIYCRANP